MIRTAYFVPSAAALTSPIQGRCPSNTPAKQGFGIFDFNKQPDHFLFNRYCTELGEYKKQSGLTLLFSTLSGLGLHYANQAETVPGHFFGTLLSMSLALGTLTTLLLGTTSAMQSDILENALLHRFGTNWPQKLREHRKKP